MKKYDILYDWPISEITRMADSEEANTFFEGLASKKDEFLLIAEELRAAGEALSAKKVAREYLPEDEWSKLIKSLEAFELGFPGFPDSSLCKFRLFCLIATKLTAPGPELDENEVNGHQFDFRVMDPELPLIWFAKENGARFEDSIAIFSLSKFEPRGDGEPSPFQLALEAATLSPQFIFALLGSLVDFRPDPTKQIYSIKNVTDSIQREAAEAFARLSVVSSGLAVHAPRVYPHELRIIDQDVIRAGISYHQMNDVIDVISEYNERKDTLAKYLTIYHVFENFMFKAPLVAIERGRGGSMFSIRDFRRLYGEVERREIDVLKKLFEEIFLLEINPGVIPELTFKDRVASKFGTFCVASDVPGLDALFVKLGMCTRSQSLTHAMFSSDVNSARFAQLIYSVRNVIVHNTATEWHLTSGNYDDSCRLLLEEFLLPVLEEMAFYMLCSPNNQVWYLNRNLALF